MFYLIGLVLFFIYGVTPFAEKAGFGMESPVYWIGGILVFFLGLGFLSIGGESAARTTGRRGYRDRRDYYDEDY